MGPLLLIALVLIGLALVGFVFRVLFTLAKIALVVGAVLLLLGLLA
ncbi:MAG TPA: hypothetical protein VK837_10305 [Longimicrobiales bacterium]|jgi:hypothetical protein|nr:hypothetical protein [Longimicrobiales bacterium]